MADEGLSAFDVDVTVVTQGHQFANLKLFQFVAWVNSQRTLQNRHAIPPWAYLLRMRVDYHEYEVRVPLSLMSPVSINLKQNDFDVILA